MNFKKWSKVKFNLFMIFSYLFYYIISVITPLVYIVKRFKLTIKPEQIGHISGVALILVVLAFIELLKRSKGLLAKLPDEKHSQALFKYTVEGIFSLILPVGVIIGIIFLKVDWKFYSETIIALATTQIISTIFYTYVVRFVDKEIRQRKEASAFNEMSDRRELMR